MEVYLLMRRIVIVTLAAALSFLVAAQAHALDAIYQMNYINAVTYLNSTTAFGVGNGSKILRSTDGGKTWSYRDPGIPVGSYYVLRDIALSGAEGLVVGNYGTVLVSNDSGSTWVRSVPQTATDELQACAISQGLMLGVGGYWDAGKRAYQGVVYRSADGGKTWKRAAGGVWDQQLNDVVFVGSTAWIAAENGQLYTTTDGVSATKTGTGGFRLAQGPTNVVWSYGSNIMNNYLTWYYRKDVAGAWKPFSVSMFTYSIALRPGASGTVGWMAGNIPKGSSLDYYPAVLYTSTPTATDPSWKVQYKSPTAYAYGDRKFRDIAFGTSTQGVIGGEKGPMGGGWMLYSADAGKTWTDVTAKVSPGALAAKATLSVPETAKPNTSFKMTGTLRPGHSFVSPVVEVQVKSGTSYKAAGRTLYLSTRTKTSTATYSYAGTGSLPKGSYRLRTNVAARSGYPAYKSAWKYIVVK